MSRGAVSRRTAAVIAPGRTTRGARPVQSTTVDGSDGALLVGMERHLDLSSHRSRQLTRAIVAESDLIFTMGPHHLERVEALGARGKAYLLTAYPDAGPVGRPISDPMGGELGVYRATVDELETEVRRVFDRLAAERVPGAS